MMSCRGWYSSNKIMGHGPGATTTSQSCMWWFGVHKPRVCALSAVCVCFNSTFLELFVFRGAALPLPLSGTKDGRRGRGYSLLDDPGRIFGDIFPDYYAHRLKPRWARRRALKATYQTTLRLVVECGNHGTRWRSRSSILAVTSGYLTSNEGD